MHAHALHTRLPAPNAPACLPAGCAAAASATCSATCYPTQQQQQANTSAGPSCPYRAHPYAQLAQPDPATRAYPGGELHARWGSDLALGTGGTFALGTRPSASFIFRDATSLACFLRGQAAQASAGASQPLAALPLRAPVTVAATYNESGGTCTFSGGSAAAAAANYGAWLGTVLGMKVDMALSARALEQGQVCGAGRGSACGRMHAHVCNVSGRHGREV